MGLRNDTDLIKVDDRFPEVGLLLVEVPHTDLTEVTWMVFVQIGPVVVLTTGHTTTSGIYINSRNRLVSLLCDEIETIY